MTRAFHTRRARPTGRVSVVLRILVAAALAVASLSLWPESVSAASGSGTATILPPSSVVAGKTGTWTITYVAAENFAPHPTGGEIEIIVPAGWTPPQLVDSTAAGWVKPANSTYVASITTSGQAIRLRLGTPSNQFTTGTAVSVIYGRGGGPASARADTVAPATAVFQTLSDPQNLGALQPIASSPSVSVVPDVVTHVRIVNAALQPVADLSRTTDQDTTHLYLRGYDKYGNSARFVGGAWGLTGAIGSAAPANGVGTVLTLTSLGSGFATADSGAWSDSTGAITVAHGAFSRLSMTAATTAVAGFPFAATVEALDADGNRVTSGPGSAVGIRFLAYADSLGPTPADPDLVSDTESLSFGFWSGTRAARRSGLFFLAARDTVSGIESAPRRRVLVAPAPPDHALLLPDTLRLTAGVPESVTVIVFDTFGNRTPVSADEELTLWTDRAEGSFTDLSGNPGNEIFAVTIPAGSDSASFRFTDPRTTIAVGRVRAIDANGAVPFLGTAAAPVFTTPNVPTGPILLTAAADTLVADGVDSTAVASGVVRDAYGNAVAAGERFLVAGTSVTVLTDEDLGVPGAQWIALAGGTISGRVRADLVKGPGSVSIVSERGSASGSKALTLIAGPPAGAISLLAVPDSLAADSASVRSLAASGLVDANSNAVEDGEAYTVATSLGSIATADLDPGTLGVQVLASGGAISFDLFGGDSLGLASVTATSVRGASTGNVAVRLVPGTVDAAVSSFAAATPVVVGAPGSVATITLRDVEGHAIASFPADSIDVSATGVPVAVTPLATATDASGSIAYTVVSTVAGTAALGAQVPTRGVLLDDAPSIVFTPGALDHYIVSGPAPPLTAGIGGLLTVQARDIFDNGMPSRSGDILRPVATGGAALLPDSVTLLNGMAVVSMTPTLAAPLTIQVADDSSRAVVYGPVAVGPGEPWRTIASPPAAATLAAGDSTTVLATLHDAYGNAIPGASLGSAATLGGGSATPVLATTDGSGRVTFTLRAGSAPGTAAYRLFAPGSAADDSIAADTVSVAVVPASAATVTIAEAGPSVIAGALLDVTLTLRDAFGNVAKGTTPSIWLRTTSGLPDSVSWSLGAGAQGALSDSASGDGARYAFAAADSGVAVMRVRATRAETMRLRASGLAPTLPLDESGDVAVIAAAPASLAILGGNGQTAVVGRALAQPLRVVARDAFGNAAPGAVVSFRVTSGNGSVDAIAGGSADSTSTTDAAGVATCDVARVGTVAGASTDVYRAGLVIVTGPAAEVFFTASATPDTAFSLALSPGSFSLAASQTATVTATARDAFGNTVPGAGVTLYLGTPIAGTLESLGGTSGSGASQAGVTDAAGQLAVRYRAPNSAPAADSIFARGATIAPVGIRASVGTSAIAALRILPDATTWTAGVQARVRVQALDAFGNLAVADTGTVVVGATDAVAFAPPSGSLVGGWFETFATATLADTLTLTASLAASALTDSAGPISVGPAAPAGAIAAAASRTELTADGRSSAAISFGPARDAFGNLVPAGTLLTVSAQAGSLLAADVSPAPGVQIAVAADDTARAILVAPATAGPDTVRVVSVAGSASGSIAYGPGSLAPAVVAPGQSAAFRLLVRNTGATGSVTVGATSSLGFGAGPGAFTASPTAPLTLAAGAADTLRFATGTISTSLSPGTYAPSLRLVGVDQTGDPFDFYVELSGAQVHVAGVTVLAAGASPNPVPLGFGSLILTFDVSNLAAVTASIDGVALQTSIGIFTVNGVSPPLPASLPALGTTSLALSVTVPAGGVPPGSIVGARLVATTAYGAVSVTGQNAATLDFQVVSAAQLTSQPAGTSPVRYLRGQTFSPWARVVNGGAAAVTLDRGATRLVLERGPADSLIAPLSSDAVANGGGTADLAFDSLAVPAGATKGRYAAWLILRGSESGQPFAVTIPLAPDSVDVADPAILVVTGNATPSVVSAGQTRTLTVTLSNSGDTPFVLDASTRLVLDAPILATLIPASADTVPALGSLAVAFAGAPIGSPASPGSALARLEARGTEDGRFREESLDAGTVTASPPAVLSFVAGSATPDTLRAGQTYTIDASIRNDGGSPYVVNPASTRLVISDGVESVVALASGSPFTLSPASQAVLTFPAAAVPAALASQPYPVTLVVHGAEWGQAESVTVVSSQAEVSVVEPVAAVQVQGLDPGAPVQASPDDGPIRIWTLELQPLVPPGGAGSARLVAAALTVLNGGTPAANPSASIADITLRDAFGNLLAQAAPGASNPVNLTLGAPVTLTGPAVAVHVEVTLQPGVDVPSVGLRVASGGDVSVLDDLSGLPVSIRATGGLPFAPLTSPFVTLFAKAHGYPNPFRAGREAVLLSYRLAADASVRVSIYTLLGGLVRDLALASGQTGGSRGLNEVAWDGRNGAGDLVRPGVYVAVIEGGGVNERIKVGVLR